VLPALRGPDGRSLTVAPGASVAIDRSRTPTRLPLQETAGGFDYYAPPTRFTIATGAIMRVDAGGTLGLVNRSVMHVMPGAVLELDARAKVSVDNGCAIITHGDGQVKAKKKLLKKLRKKRKLIVA
jgi:hypothetical protein